MVTSDGIVRNDSGKRGRGRPPGADTSGRLTIQMRPATKARLESLGALQRRPLWQIIDTALHIYFDTLPAAGRRAVEPAPQTVPDRQWVSLTEFIGDGEVGGSSLTRLSTKAITASAMRRGIDPVVYLDGTCVGRHRLELAIQHRSEVLSALEAGETVPDTVLEAYSDLAPAKSDR